MGRCKAGLLRFLASALILLGAAIAGSSPSAAYVNQIIIDATNTANYNPVPLGSSTPGASVSYTIYTGRIIGALSPTQPQNSVITDINLAPTTGGLVNYTAEFSILTPTNPALRNGLMIHVVPNRGGNGINTNALVAGATYVQSGWQGDLLSQCSSAPVPPYPCVSLSSPYGTPTASYPFFAPPTGLADFVVQVPVATSDGTPPNGTNTITGQVYGHVCVGPNGCPLAAGTTTSTSHLAIQGPAFVPYQPVSTDTNQAQLWTVAQQTLAGVDGPKTLIPSADWAWAYCPSGWPGTPNPNYICLNGTTFNPNLLYEVVYTAANPLVLGVGFAAFRDLASFLRYGTTAPGGGSNPIAGTVTTAMTVGASQSGAFIHGFIFYGFNEDEDGRIVFDGAWPQIDDRMMVMNIRWGQPNNLMYLYMGGDEAPVWWADYPNLARNLPADGMLHRCTATGTCPQIIETFGSAELYSEKMSVGLCGFTCVADIPLPPNVYRYYSPGATHGGGTVSFAWSAPGIITPPTGQTYPTDPIPETYTNNALQADFINWLMNGIAMPPSVYPTLARGELVPNIAMAEGFPTIPGFPFAGNQAWPPFVYDFGPDENYDQQSGIPTTQPPHITQVLPVYATTVNMDGNENVTGLPTVLGQAPLGTYVGWNLTSIGWYTGQVIPGAGGSGSFWPFWDTKANRLAAGDPRLSLEERYGTHSGYECAVATAANNAVAQRFLLSDDATALNGQAATSNVLASPFMPTAADTTLGNALCADQPVVIQVTPASGPAGGGTVVTITGNDFSGVTAVYFGSTPAASFAVNGMTSITATSPPGSPSTTVDISVTTSQGTSANSASDQFSYGAAPLPTPSVTGVSPNSGAAAGGTTVSITGTNFTGATQVMFGSTAASSFTVNSATSITATVPASASLGPVNVTVTTPSGTSQTSAADEFSYQQPPVVTAVSPAKGPTLGGTIVNISGTGFAGATGVKFGTAAASFSVNSSTSITAIAANNIGTVDVTVTTPVGTSATGTADQFSYQPSHDFNGDGKSDLAWRDTSNNIGVWLMNGSSILQGNVLGAVPSNWAAVGQRDFNGDGKSDLLWRDTSGDVGMWLMNGTQIVSTTVLGLVPTTWSVAATGDFNGDGKGDIVWRDTSGNVGIWLMNGTSVMSSVVVGNVPTNWVIVGADMKGEIFWYNLSTGEVGLWVVSGTTVVKTVDFGAAPANWTIAGLGDFDGNGSTDVLWRDSSGDVGIWLMNGTSIMSSGVVGRMPLSWTIAQTGDYSGTGKSDVLWTDGSGDVQIWFMNGTTTASTASIGNVGTTWTAQSLNAD
jgi:alpha/beta hydrolase family protein/IPT/TIG domain-containing protein/VCBS repeat protein